MGLGVSVLAQEKPVPRIPVEVRRDERPEALQAVSVEPHREAAVLLLLDQLVGATIPDLDRPGAVLTGGYLSLEVGVGERMILDVNRQVTLGARHGHALRHRPAREDAAPLEPQVIVEPARRVPLDDESQAARSVAVLERLWRARGIPLASIVLEWHKPHHRGKRHGA